MSKAVISVAICAICGTKNSRLIRRWRRLRRGSTRRLDAPDAPPQQQDAQRRQECGGPPTHASARVCLQGVTRRRGATTQRCAEERQKRFAGQFSAFALCLRAFASRLVALQPDSQIDQRHGVVPASDDLPLVTMRAMHRAPKSAANFCSKAST